MTSWSRHPDSNRGPTHYECVALPTEPCRPAPFDFAVAKVIIFLFSNKYNCYFFATKVLFMPPELGFRG